MNREIHECELREALTLGLSLPTASIPSYPLHFLPPRFPPPPPFALFDGGGDGGAAARFGDLPTFLLSCGAFLDPDPPAGSFLPSPFPAFFCSAWAESFSVSSSDTRSVHGAEPPCFIRLRKLTALRFLATPALPFWSAAVCFLASSDGASLSEPLSAAAAFWC